MAIDTHGHTDADAEAIYGDEIDLAATPASQGPSNTDADLRRAQSEDEVAAQLHTADYADLSS